MDNQEHEIDVDECIFEVVENGEVIWSGLDYENAFFLRNMDRESRKVMVRAKVDVTLETFERIVPTEGGTEGAT